MLDIFQIPTNKHVFSDIDEFKDRIRFRDNLLDVDGFGDIHAHDSVLFGFKRRFEIESGSIVGDTALVSLSKQIKRRTIQTQL